MDEKWKVRGKDKVFHSHYTDYSPHFDRSFSTSNTGLTRSSSLKTAADSSSSSSSSGKKQQPYFGRSSSQKCADFTQKCSSLAKEHKARFYIVKRCICMLVRWKKNEDS